MDPMDCPAIIYHRAGDWVIACNYAYLPHSQGVSTLVITTKCPVDLQIIDPDGWTISKQINEIPGALYIETDLNGDGDPDDRIIIPNKKDGTYQVTIIPEADANPSDTFTFKMVADDQTVYTAENVPIGLIPEGPLEVTVAGEDVIVNDIFGPIGILTSPAVTTGSVSLLGSTSVTLNGYLDSLGGYESCDVYFMYKPSSDQVWQISSFNLGLITTGAFSKTIYGLIPGTNYEFKAIATNPTGSDHGGINQFTTKNDVPPSPTPTLTWTKGYVWNDLNANGDWDSGEPGIEGVPIELWTADDNWNLVTCVYRVSTDMDGYYEFALPIVPGTKHLLVENLFFMGSQCVQTYPGPDSAIFINSNYGWGWEVDYLSTPFESTNNFGNYLQDTGTISIISIPEGATVYVDDIVKGSTPLEISDISPGIYTVKLTKSGYEDYLETVDVIAGQTEQVSATLVPTFKSQIRAPDIVLQPGETITKTIDINGVDISGLELDLDYDASLVLISAVGNESFPAPVMLVFNPDSMKIAAIFNEYPGVSLTSWTSVIDLTITSLGPEGLSVLVFEGANYIDTTFTTKDFAEVANGSIHIVKIPQDNGSIIITSTPESAEVYLDGTLKGSTPLEIPDIPPGIYTVKLTKSGYEDYQETVNVVGGQTEQVSATLAPTSKIIDLTTTGATVSHNGAILIQGEFPSMEGIIPCAPFVRTYSNNPVQMSYNTEYLPIQEEFDTVSNVWYTHSLQLKDVPVEEYPEGSGHYYYQFMGNINQVAIGDRALLSIDELRIFLSNRGDLHDYNTAINNFDASGGGPADLVWDLDGDQDSWVKLNYMLEAADNNDITLLLPIELFGANEEKYVYFVTQSGAMYPHNGDFEEWGVLPIGTWPLEIINIVDWNGYPIDSDTFFDICITGPSYPAGHCETVNFTGGSLFFDSLIPGEYHISASAPDDSWSVQLPYSDIIVGGPIEEEQILVKFIKDATPISGPGTIENLGQTVFIGEEGLNFDPVLTNNFPGATSMQVVYFGENDPSFDTWINSYAIHKESPNYIDPEIFESCFGPWYVSQEHPDNPQIGDPFKIAFWVDRPAIDVKVYTTETGTDVTDGTVTKGEQLTFRIYSNLWKIFTERVYQPSDDAITIRLTDEQGIKYSALFNASSQLTSIQDFKIDSDVTYRLGSVSNPVWDTNQYSSGVYMFSALCDVNNMDTNYGITRATISPTYSLAIEENVLPQDLPDLVISELTWEPVNPQEGDQVVFSYVIANIGSENATPFECTLFVDNAFNEVLWEDPLPPGTSIANNVSLPWTATAGIYNVTMIVDSSFIIPELDKSNNMYIGILEVSETPTPENTAPTAYNDTAITDEDTPIIVDELVNDTDPDNDVLTPFVIESPSHGNVTLNVNGTFTYSPEGDWNGNDGFTYLVNDGSADSNVAHVMVTVNPVNDAPVAVDDTLSTDEDTPITFDVLANDLDVDEDSLTPFVIESPEYGNISQTVNGSFTYTPLENWNGNDSFKYQVNDGSEDSNVAMVLLTINSLNDVPVAYNDSVNTTEDTPLIIDVLVNDQDIDNDSLSPFVIESPSNGVLSQTVNDSFLYTPTDNWNGNDLFTYAVSDGVADSNIATVLITVYPINDVPLAYDDTIHTNEDTPVTFDVLVNDVDIEGDPLEAFIVTNPSNGLLTKGADGNFTYIPEENWNGCDEFTYNISDGLGYSDAATVLITVDPINDVPMAYNDSVATDEDTSVIFDVRFNDGDIDGDSLEPVVVTYPLNGLLFKGVDGNFTYTPEENWNGYDTFTYLVDDGNLESNVTVVSITVNPINDAPEAYNDTFCTDEDAAVTLDLLANDVDVDEDPLEAVIASNPPNGLLAIDKDGYYTYTPDESWKGDDSFTYTAFDGLANSSIAYVSIDIFHPVSIAAFPETVLSGESFVTEISGHSNTTYYLYLVDALLSEGDTYPSIIEGQPGVNITPEAIEIINAACPDMAPSSVIQSLGTVAAIVTTSADGSASVVFTTNETTPKGKYSIKIVNPEELSDEDSTKINVAKKREKIKLACPAHLHVYDASGNHIGFNPETGEIELMIPNAVFTGNTSAGIPEEITLYDVDTFESVVDSYGEGTFDLVLTASTFREVTQISYEEITINPESSASVKISPQDNGNILIVDVDGDGSNDDLIEPDSILIKQDDVSNYLPIIRTIEGPIDPIPVNTELSVSINFTDLEDSHTVSIEWGDNSSSTCAIVKTVDSGTAVGTHVFTSPGIYTIRCTVEDSMGATDTEEYQYIVIYDPDGGFVTGGGWIDSPEGAYYPDPALTGKATFGFVSKYKKGATVPEGQTQFQFKAGDLNFHSDSYDFLVIAGKKAMCKGTGTINGEGNYGFMISAIDEALTPSKDVDLFRIKIWDKDDGDAIIYDNQLGAEEDADPTTAIGGGSIVIHTK
ncbi:hypothetical protein AZH53_03970 [Methanomicrobiaceae archaeon CYW5]|nr:hypothetical protein [Methanovulcanius yangii]